ncbi:MAG: hypothetical protein ACR5LC_12080, partial [Symbiopectobacterium sp.]
VINQYAADRFFHFFNRNYVTIDTNAGCLGHLDAVAQRHNFAVHSHTAWTLGYSKSSEMHDRIIGTYIEREYYV